MRIARSLLTVICIAGVTASSLLLAIHLPATGVLLVGQVAGLSVSLAIILMITVFVAARMVAGRGRANHEVIVSFEKKTIKGFVKATIAGVTLGGTAYLLWLIFAPDRISIRFMFLVVSFVVPLIEFDNSVSRLLRVARIENLKIGI
jgi:hypothetical protein